MGDTAIKGTTIKIGEVPKYLAEEAIAKIMGKGWKKYSLEGAVVFEQKKSSKYKWCLQYEYLRNSIIIKCFVMIADQVYSVNEGQVILGGKTYDTNEWKELSKEYEERIGKSFRVLTGPETDPARIAMTQNLQMVYSKRGIGRSSVYVETSIYVSFFIYTIWRILAILRCANNDEYQMTWGGNLFYWVFYPVLFCVNFVEKKEERLLSSCCFLLLMLVVFFQLIKVGVV